MKTSHRLLLIVAVSLLTSSLALAQDEFTSRKKMDHTINSQYPELSPIVSPDGKYLYVERRDILVDYPTNTYGCDDIWFSEMQSSGKWSTLSKMPYPISNRSNNDLIAVSPDNNTLFMTDTSCTPPKEMKFYVSHKTVSGWSNPKGARMKNSYNLDIYSEACLSSDWKTMIISMSRTDSYGKSDLYVSFLENDSTWSEPKNIGNVVNSGGSDISPFLAPDNVTLYYSTDGWAGYGSSDIYMTRRLDDTWQNWSAPKNMGPEINTVNWEAYFTIPASGDYSYFSSTHGLLNNLDIFKVKTPEGVKPNPVVLIQGKVLDSKTKQPITATIVYENLSGSGEVGRAISDPVTGEYKIILPYGKIYGYHATATGYFSISENMDLSVQKNYIEITQDLLLVPIVVGNVVALNNVFFVQSKPALITSSYAELDRLVKILQDNPKIEIELHGHTDNTGNADLNMKLSEERVKTVKNYILSKGINAARIKGKGFGGTQPIASNETEETRKLNRRVEFIVTKQ